MKDLNAVPARERITEEKDRGSLRNRILASVGALIVLSLVASALSLYRITEVNRSLDSINRVSVPLGRLLTQMQSDAEVLKRELDRRLGSSHWGDPHWKPKPVPAWITDVLASEVARATELIEREIPGMSPEARKGWRKWVEELDAGYGSLKSEAQRLYLALESKNPDLARDIHTRWGASLEEWTRQLHWGIGEYDRALRLTFSVAEKRVSELRTGLELILIAVVFLSLMLLWLGERALRPLNQLTALAREITRRGLRKEDKSLLPGVSLSRKDEVSQLAREFHNMATALLEREKTVESQNARLQEQNRLLREIGGLNQNILNSIQSILIVTDPEGRITQCNPAAATWLESDPARILSTSIRDWAKLEEISAGIEASEARKISSILVGGRTYSGQVSPLAGAGGAILVLEDMTEELDLQERLRRAENLAAVGRLSAQVAHEVRNPLHSIGLEAEMAAELAAKSGQIQIRQSLQSILASVDRLGKITENYLRLSRLSAGKRIRVDLGEILESALAAYTPSLESEQIRVEWRREQGCNLALIGDPDLLEQALGNLFRNSIQALGNQPGSKWIECLLGNTETGKVWLRVRDSGPGVRPDMIAKLFTPFMTTKAEGTGLGLSFVKQVMEEHGGEIRLLEVPKDEAGACFEIRLPQAPLELATDGRLDATPET